MHRHRSWLAECMRSLCGASFSVSAQHYTTALMQTVGFCFATMTLAAPALVTSMKSVNSPSHYLFRFDEPLAVDDWSSIDDVVMGGQSRSALVIADRALVFSGHVSLANNGGFASVRSSAVATRYVDATAIVLRVKGDGKRYKLNLKTDASFDGAQYQARFQPGAGVWEIVYLPLRSFVATYRGRRVPDVPPVRSADIRTVGLMVSERQAGPFTLKVKWIGLHSGARSGTGLE